MNFVISSSEFLSYLQSVSKVINAKNTLPILDNYLFQIKNKQLTITASDLESTLITKLALDNCDGDGNVAVPAKILNDALKEFSDQPLTFNFNLEKLFVDISSETGKFTIPCQSANDFPKLPTLKEGVIKVSITKDILLSGINNTLFATADDELRPVMNGIFVELNSDNVTFAASDSHKLVRYRRTDFSNDNPASFILPKKPASLLKNILPKEENDVVLEFDEKNAVITTSDYKLVCRLTEGNYPNYSSVIPTNNPNKLTVDRIELYNTLRRVSLFSSQSSNLVRLSLSGNQITISAQDIDFAVSGTERLNCQFDGDEMEIGFKSTFLLEILSNLPSTEVLIELSDPARAGLILPFEKENEEEDILMLLMPMMIN